MLSLMPKPPAGDARRISEILARGVAHHTAGDLGAAEACYREILRLEPAHPDASHLLGVAAALQGLDDYDGAAELLKRGIEITEPTVAKYLPRRSKPPSQTWRTFLDNHAKSMVSVDFFTVPTLRFQVLYVFLVLAHDRRRILQFGVTAHPTAEWTVQQVRTNLP